MNKRIVFIVSMLALLLVANALMLYGYTNYPEGFASYNLGAAPSSPKTGYEKIGTYDGVVNVPKNGVSQWRDTLPNEPLEGPAPDVANGDMFLFANNQQKPECCPSTFSSDLGCVCTTPQQRALLQARGGNRNDPVDELPFT